jgi:hypothetical protein
LQSVFVFVRQGRNEHAVVSDGVMGDHRPLDEPESVCSLDIADAGGKANEVFLHGNRPMASRRGSAGPP